MVLGGQVQTRGAPSSGAGRLDTQTGRAGEQATDSPAERLPQRQGDQWPMSVVGAGGPCRVVGAPGAGRLMPWDLPLWLRVL